MAEIKLKVIGAAGDTLSVSRAGERISLVHTAPYADGDWIALECDEPGLYCVVQFEDTMPPALVYIRERGLDFPIPPADNRVNYSPRSFTGSLFGIQCTCTCHLLRARLATAEEVTARAESRVQPLRLPRQPRVLPTRIRKCGNPRRGCVCRAQRRGWHL